MPKAKKVFKHSPETKVTTGCQSSIMSFFHAKPKSVDHERGSFKQQMDCKKDKSMCDDRSVSDDGRNSDSDVIIIDEHPSSVPGRRVKSKIYRDGAVDSTPRSEITVEKTSLKLKASNSATQKTQAAVYLEPKSETDVKISNSDLCVELRTPTQIILDKNDDTGMKPVIEVGVESQQYYHKHFLHVMETVLSEQENSNLFNDYDLVIINSFKNLAEKEQNLFIRLFGRKHKWIRSSALKYPEISTDLSDILDALISADLLQHDKDLADMGTALRLLLMPELKLLCKHFGVGLVAKGKEQIIEAFQQHCQQQTSIKRFFNTASIEKKVIAKAKELAGRCFRLQAEPRKVFIRLLLLFSLTGLAEDEEDSANGGQQKKLVTLLMVEKGHLTFPKYEVTKQVPVFRDRESLIRYEQAKQLELDILNYFNNKCFHEAYDLFLTAQKLYSTATDSEELFSDSQHPVFLQRFTASHVYVRCLNHGVDVLQKLKKYQDAVDLLRLLLGQQLFCKMYRGHWWDRLTLLLDYHLKNPKLTLEALFQSLEDSNLRPAHRYALIKRAQKIIEQKKKQEAKTVDTSNKKRKLSNEANSISVLEKTVENECFQEAPKVTIVGRLLPGGQTGCKNVFVLPSCKEMDSHEDITLLSVEELAINHYQQQGYSQGIHGEGSTIVSLFCLLFWDVIYGSQVPDVFRSPYQSWPLDLNTDIFYENRRAQIDAMISVIQKSSKTELENTVASCWDEHVGSTSLVNWDLFTGPAQVKELVHSFTNEALAGICERLAKDFRHCRSGFPDLIVWNPVSHQVKVVEVKGPNDRLSPKQIVWLHCLLQLKVPVEVCHINAVGAKKLHS